MDAVLEETRAVQQRLRDLPSRVGVYFLLAMCLFPEVGYRLVWDKMTAGLGGLLPAPSTKGLRDLRRRVGCAPMKTLFEVVAGALAQPHTPGARFGPTAPSPSTAAAPSRPPTANATGAGWADARAAAIPSSS
ncbi:transposase domain-containing protein [[Kitasatospora] papulosa]|uniref:transposase domain-containing protein n=1 Tax=[Kitasatospora] papulosa TaxID=1464011 RepID=UPI00369E1A76